ncbi:MAG: RNA methyltransferase [Acidimicrobiia bacterium]|nr:RNA methyltransferase [Acidimicrobiia bacterium]
MIEAFESGLEIDFVIVPSDQHPDPEIAERCDVGGVRLFGLAPEAFAGLSDARTPQPALAVVTMPVLDLDERFVSDNAMFLVLVDIADPGNVGTLLRTAEATGCQGVVVTSTTADVTSPKVVRASAGSVLRVPIAEVDGDVLAASLRQLGAHVVATAMNGVAYDQVALDRDASVALLLGSEAHGLDEVTRGLADHVVSIPMHGRVESLNVATAGAVLAFDLAAKRRSN